MNQWPSARRSPWGAAPLLAALAVVAPANRLAAEEARPQIEAVRVGFGGRYKVGFWAPVTVQLKGGPESFVGQFELELPDGDGEPSRIVLSESGGSDRPRAVQLVAREVNHVPLVAKFGQLDGALRVVLRSEGREIASRRFETGESSGGQGLPTPLYSTQQLIVNVGPSAGIEPGRSDPFTAGEVVELRSLDELPTRWIGYDPVDWVVICTSQPELFRGLEGSRRLEALEQWVRLGGRLVLSVGSQADEVLRSDGPLARFAPGRLRSIVRLPSSAGLETFVGSREPLVWPGNDQRPPVAALTDVQGTIEAYEGHRPEDLPLVIRAPFGLGEVLFVAFDLDLLARSAWAGRRVLLSRLLDRTGQPAEGRGRGPADDLSALLRGSLDEFRGIRPVSFTVVALLLVLYLAAIGPFDYFIVRKWCGPEWTWITFPLYVTLACGAAWFLAQRFKGDQLRINQLDLVDVDLQAGFVRGTTWANVFSPRAETFDLATRPAAPAGLSTGPGDAVLAWFGLPGNVVGGLDSQGAIGLFRRPYEMWVGPGRLVDLPIQVWSSRSVVGRWQGALPAPAASQLRETGSRATRLLNTIEGTIDNPVDVPLTECVVLYGDSAYPLGDLAAGQPIRITRDTPWRTIRSYFGTATQVGLQGEALAWDPETREPLEVLRVMLFYSAIDGYRYTRRMVNHYQRFVDLSPVLAGGRAVFLGYGPLDQPAVRLAEADQPLGRADNQARAIYRLIVPVERTAAP